MWTDTLKQTFKHKIRGREILLEECPFCNNPKYNIEFNMDKKIFHCWTCEAKGTVASFFRMYNLKMDDTDWASTLSIKSKVKGDDLVIDNFVPIVYDRHKSFFKGRGLDPEDISKYNMLTSPKGKFRNKLILPLYEGGKLVYFVAKDLLLRKNYSNPAINKKDLLPYFLGEVNRLTIHLCEGVFDAISLNKLGFSVGVLLGSSISPGQIRKIKKFGFREAVVALDGDAKEKALRVYGRIKEKGIAVRAVMFSEGDDPNSLYVSDSDYLRAVVTRAKELTTMDKVKVVMGTCK